MIRRIVGWFVLLPLCAVLVIFALANRQSVPVRFDPVGFDNPLVPAVNVPLFIVIYGMLILGVIFGGMAAWFAQGHNRRDKRRYRRETERLNRELADVRRATRQPAGRALPEPDDFLEDD